MDKAKDRIGYLFVTALGVSAFWVAGDFRPESAVFPRFVSGLMAALGLLLLARSFRAPAQGVALDGVETEASEDGFFIHPGRFVTVVLLSLVYCLLVQRIGYFTASSVMIPLMAFVIGLRSPFVIFASTVLYVVVAYATFEWLFNRPLMPELILQILP